MDMLLRGTVHGRRRQGNTGPGPDRTGRPGGACGHRVSKAASEHRAARGESASERAAVAGCSVVCGTSRVVMATPDGARSMFPGVARLRPPRG